MTVRRSVLVAEDDENDRFLMQWAFEKSGSSELIDFARDGQETIDFLKKNSVAKTRIDTRLLLLDIRMPSLDGFQVLEWLQHNPSLRPARVIVLSSSSDPRDIERAKALGADEYNVKPHGLSAYIKMIQDFFCQSMNPGEPAKSEAGSCR